MTGLKKSTLLAGLDPDYYFLRMAAAKNDSRLFLTFSAAGATPGKFSYFHSFDVLQFNVLHVTPPQPRSWYLTGLVGLHDEPDAAFKALGERLRKWCPENGIKELIVVGTSMGGYAALRFATRANPGVPVRVIAMGTEIRPMLPGSISFKDNPGGGDFPSLEHEDYSGLEVQLVFGEFSFVDSYCALLLKGKPGVSLYSLAVGSHDIAGSVHARIGFIPFFTDFIERKEFFGQRGYLAEALDVPDIAPLIFNAPGSSAFNQAIDCCLNLYPGFALAWNRKAVHLIAQGQYAEAIQALKRSLSINPEYENSLAHLARARGAYANQQTTH